MARWGHRPGRVLAVPGVWALFDSTTLVDITGAGYIGVYNVMFGIAIFLMLIFFCLQLITGLVRRDAGSLGRAALGLAKSVLGSFLVITLTATLLEVVDQLSIGIIQATGTTLEEMGGKIGVLVGGLTAITLTAPARARSSRSSCHSSRSARQRSSGSPC